MGELGLELGGFHLAVESDDPSLLAIARERYAGFLGGGPADWRLVVRSGPLAASGVPDVVVERVEGGDRVAIRRDDFLGHLDFGKRAVEATFADPDRFSLDSFMRVMMSLVLLEAPGLLVHAASLARDEGAYLFPGRSGSGKTTVARLSPDAILLSDELSIVTLERGGAVCHGTPFWGELARGGTNRRRRLRAVHFLAQADHDAARPLGPRAALQALLPNVVFFARDAGLVGRVVTAAAALVESAPCFALAFRRHPAFWDVVRRA